MAVRPILSFLDPALRKLAAPVAVIDSEVKTLVADMFETMYEAPGIGLAANQVGVLKRIAVVDVAEEDRKQPIALINPEIVWTSDELEAYEEGCLSIPDYYEEVVRPARCRVRYTDLHGRTGELEAEGLLAVCVQHEVDHLDGKLFLDHLSKLKRDLVTRKFRTAAKRGTAPVLPKREKRERRAPRPVSPEEAASLSGQ